jgi:hypothetical protein
LKKSSSAPGEVFWKRVYVIFCIILLFLTAVQLFSFVLSDPHSGWDYRVFVGAVQDINHGKDPYLPVNIYYYTHESIPFTFAPHTLLFFWCLQFFYNIQSIWLYYAMLVALLVASGYIIVNLDKKPEYLFIITLLLTGFISTFWNFRTGNKEIFFLFLFACIFYLLVKEKFWQSSIIMGLMGSCTLVPLPFMALYLVVKRPILKRLQYIFLSICVVVAIFLVTWLINPTLFVSYIKIFPGTSALHEPISDSITPFLMFDYLLNQMNGGNTIFLILVSFIYIGLIIGATWYVIRQNQENQLKVYSLAMLAIFMVLPRIKPYYFIDLAIPLYFLFKDSSDKIKILVFAIISLLPLGSWYYFWIDHTQPIPYLVFLIHQYSQTFSLFLIFVITISLEYYNLKYSSSSHS